MIAFVDAIEGQSARLVVPCGDGWITVDAPLALFPGGLVEGAWIEICTRQVPPPPEGQEALALRALLGRGDPGGDIAL